MGVAGSPPAERAGGRHRRIAGASGTEASRPSGGDTRIGCVAGEEYWVRWCWRPGKCTPHARAGKNVSSSGTSGGERAVKSGSSWLGRVRAFEKVA